MTIIQVNLKVSSIKGLKYTSYAEIPGAWGEIFKLCICIKHT